MTQFEWKDQYSVFNEHIDTHHKKLISLFNEIGTLIQGDDDVPLFSTIKVISELNIYAIFHFKEEEKLMEQGNYPQLEAHRKSHAAFIQKVKDFKEEYMNNDPLVNYDIYKFLSDWLVKHILTEDAEYIDYI